MTVPNVVGVRCNYCSRFRAPHQIHQLQSGQVICEYCLDWHHHAIAFLGGEVPRGCQECGTTWETLRDMPGLAVKMYVVQKDGVYQLLCSTCCQKYLPKRRDLYKGSQFGETL